MKSSEYEKKAGFYARCAYLAEKNHVPTEKVNALKNTAKKCHILAEEAYFLEHRFDKAKKEKVSVK